MSGISVAVNGSNCSGQDHQRLGDWPTPRSYEAWKGMVHPDDLERVLAESARHIQNGERYNDEYRVVGPRRARSITIPIAGRSSGLRPANLMKCIGLLSDITREQAGGGCHFAD